jgi:hypothetical protein
MGIKGLIRDIIMAYVGIQLLLGNPDNVFLGAVLIITVIIFTIVGFMIMRSG